MRLVSAYAAASTASNTPLSRESSHSHGQYARFNAASCSLSAMLCVHTTELAGLLVPLGTPCGRKKHDVSHIAHTTVYHI